MLPVGRPVHIIKFYKRSLEVGKHLGEARSTSPFFPRLLGRRDRIEEDEDRAK